MSEASAIIIHVTIYMNTIKFYNIEILLELRRVTRPFLSMRRGGDQTSLKELRLG